MNQGVRRRALMKKTRGKISRVSVPLSVELSVEIVSRIYENGLFPFRETANASVPRNKRNKVFREITKQRNSKHLATQFYSNLP
jgi:hypothetical protein